MTVSEGADGDENKGFRDFGFESCNFCSICFVSFFNFLI